MLAPRRAVHAQDKDTVIATMALVCGSCGRAAADPTAKFCNHCGKPFYRPGAAAAGGGAGKSGASSGLHQYPHAQLVGATGGFDASVLISEEGAFGAVYKATLGASHVVAVKVMREKSPHNEEQLQRELTTVGFVRPCRTLRLMHECRSTCACAPKLQPTPTHAHVRQFDARSQAPTATH